MTNRNLSCPILGAVTCLLVISLPCLKAEPGVPADETPASAPTNSETMTPPAAPSAPAEAPAERPATYTIVSGDSLWSISHKFNCSIKQLETLNNLKPHALLHPGQVLKLPPATTTEPSPTPKPPKTTSHPPVTPKSVAVASQPKPAIHHTYLQAQPVQDFDVPASTFASCPDPGSSSDSTSTDSEAPAPVMTEMPAPVAKPVASPEIAAASAPTPPDTTTAESIPVIRETISSSPSTKHPTQTIVTESTIPSSSVTAPLPPAPKLTSRGVNSFTVTPSTDWGNRFLQEARALGDRGIEYDEDWRPPGESHAWTMDCSNTARYLYKVTTGIELPRTASDQYYYLHLQDKAWDVPQASNGFADCNFLRQNLKPGDLLFWENTYKPERQPPITHVMVFLGTNDKGQWIMAGSQTTRGGEHNRANGGPDIYVFNPTQPCGGYSTWLGFVHHQGRFCAYGRPLEADKSKLAVAAND